MFKKILLPIDLADQHQAALSATVDLARQSGGEVVLLHVIEVIAGLPEEDEFYGRLERIARKRLSPLSDQLTAQKIPSHVEIVFGNRAQEIVLHARESKVDLVILTAPQIDPDNPAVGLGSLSYKIGIFAPCPVLLVK